MIKNDKEKKIQDLAKSSIDVITKEAEKIENELEKMKSSYEKKQREIRQMSVDLRIEYDRQVEPLKFNLKCLNKAIRRYKYIHSEKYLSRKEYRGGVRTKKSKIGLRKSEYPYYDKWRKDNEAKQIRV